MDGCIVRLFTSGPPRSPVERVQPKAVNAQETAETSGYKGGPKGGRNPAASEMPPLTFPVHMADGDSILAACAHKRAGVRGQGGLRGLCGVVPAPSM